MMCSVVFELAKTVEFSLILTLPVNVPSTIKSQLTTKLAGVPSLSKSKLVLVR